MFAFCELPRKTFDIAGGNAETIHARVYFQVKRNRLARRALCCGAVQRFELLAAMDYRGQVVLQEIGFLTGPEACQHQDRLAHSPLTDVDALVGAGDAEPIRTGFLHDLCDLRAAAAVAVVFSDRVPSAGRLTLFAGGIA